MVIAESDRTVVLEGNHCFPPEALKCEFFRASTHHASCAWKDMASRLDVVVGEKVNSEAAWYYPTRNPRPIQYAGISHSGAVSACRLERFGVRREAAASHKYR